MAKVHATAIVDANAQLADTVEVGPFCIIGPNVKIDEGTKLESSVVVKGHTTIGKNNVISASAVIGTAPQDLKYKNEPTQVIIGDNNTIREFVTINLSTSIDEPTTVGNGNLIMAYAHIAHNCHVGNNNVIANSVQLAGHVTIDNFATIGGASAVNQFARIGSYCFIGGMSGMRKDVPPFTRGAGMPCRVVGLNKIGLQRKGFTDEQIEAIQVIYNWVYRSKMTITKAIETISELGELTPEQKIFADFVINSQRGICRSA